MDARLPLQKALRSLVDSLPAAQVQNRLMACNDRDLALALGGMDSIEVNAILERLAPVKAARIRDEMQLQKGRRVESRHVVASLETIVQSLERNRSIAGQRSYLRPRRASRR